jgi:hypothetical protein
MFAGYVSIKNHSDCEDIVIYNNLGFHMMNHGQL